MAASDIGIKIGLQGAEQVRTGLAGVTNSLTDLANRAGGLRDSLGAIAPTLAAAFSVGGIATFVKSTTDALDRLNDISDATGSSVEEISKLERVAKLTGASMDTVTGTLIKFNSALKEAKPGSGADAALKAIGLEAAKLRELDPSEALRKTAVALSGFADDGNKARIVQELFGKSLKEAAPFLKDLAEAGEINATVTTQQAVEAERFNKALFALQTNSSEAARALASGLVPTLTAIAEAFNEVQSGTDKVNLLTEALRTPIEALSILGANVAFVFGGVGREIGAIAAQTVALAKLDIKGFKAISEAVKEDGVRARRELDLLEQRILAAGNVARGFVVDGMNLPEGGPKKSAKDIAGIDEAALKEAARLVEQITNTIAKRGDLVRAELEAGRALTDSEKFRLDLTRQIDEATGKIGAKAAERLKASAAETAELIKQTEERKRQAQINIRLFQEQQEIQDEIRAYNAKQNEAIDRNKLAQAELERVTRNQVDLTALEGQLLFESVETRARAIEQLKVMQAIDLKRAQLAKEIDDPEERARLLQKYATTLQAGLEEGVQRALIDDARRTFDQVSQSLADALLNGGKSAGEALKRYFKTLILQPIIRAIVNPIAGAITGTLGLAGAANASTGGLGDVLSGASSASTFFSTLNNSISSAVTNGFTQFAQSSFGARLGLSTPTATDSSGVVSNVINPGASQFGGYLGIAGNALAGYGIGSALNAGISNGFKISNGYTTFQNIGAAVAGAVAGPIGAAVVGAISGLVNRAFGRKLVDQGIQGTFGAGDGFTGEQFQFLKGGFFRSDKTKTSDLDPQLDAALSGGFRQLQTQVGVLAATLGIGSDAIGSFTREVKLSFQGLTEDQIKEKLTAEITAAGEALAELALGGTQFVKEGETASVALQRLSASLVNVNAVLGTLGLDEFAKSVAGADLASQLSDAFGGIANLQQASASYFENFYTAAEKTDTATRQLTASLGALGIEALPTTREAFRAIVESQDLTTESGRATFAALVQLSGAFAELVPESLAAADALQDVAQATRSAADILREREGLERQLLQLQGKTTELRRLERDALDESNRALFDQITALQDQADALAAQRSLNAARGSTADKFLEGDALKGFRLDQLAARFNELLGTELTGAFLDAISLSDVRGMFGRLLTENDPTFTPATQAALLELGATLADLKTPAQVAADAVEGLSAAMRGLESERRSLQRELLVLQGGDVRAFDTEGFSAAEIAVYDYNQALRDQIEALRAAGQTVQDTDTIAQERTNLEQRLLQLQGNTLALRARERALIDASNRALFDQVQALEDVQAASERAGISANSIASVLRDGLLGRLSQEDVGAQLSEAIVGGLYNALATTYADQITNTFINGIVQPMVAALIAGQNVAQAVSQASLDAVVQQAQASAKALQAVLGNADVQAALAGIGEAVSGIVGTFDAITSKPYTPPSAADVARAQEVTETAVDLTKSLQERAGLERELLTLQGDTVALRALERAEIDASNLALYDQITALRQAKAIEDERAGLNRRLLELQGDTNALRALELASLDESNRGLQQQIYDLEDAREMANRATGAANDFADAWRTVTTSLVDETRRIRGLLATESSAGYAALQTRFLVATAQARAGDAKAGQALATYASDLLSAADAQVTTRAELVKLRASVAASLEESTAILGKQAPVQGSLQPIEELVQANSDLNRTVAELKVELVIMRQQLAAIQTNTRRAADGVNGQGEGPIPVVIET